MPELHYFYIRFLPFICSPRLNKVGKGPQDGTYGGNFSNRYFGLAFPQPMGAMRTGEEDHSMGLFTAHTYVVAMGLQTSTLTVRSTLLKCSERNDEKRYEKS